MMTAEMIPTTREVKMRIPKEIGCPRRMWDEKSTIVAASVCVCRFDAELVAFLFVLLPMLRELLLRYVAVS